MREREDTREIDKIGTVRYGKGGRCSCSSELWGLSSRSQHRIESLGLIVRYHLHTWLWWTSLTHSLTLQLFIANLACLLDTIVLWWGHSPPPFELFNIISFATREYSFFLNFSPSSLINPQLPCFIFLEGGEPLPTLDNRKGDVQT